MSIFQKARFIWISNEEAPDTYGEFFSKFQYQKERGALLLRLSVDGDYTLFINGRYVNSNQYGDFEHYKIYDDLDVTPYLKEGENALALLVWHIGVNSSRYKWAPAGVIFELLQKGEPLLYSYEHTLCRKSIAYENGLSKSISAQLGISFSYNLQKEDSWITEGGEDFHEAVLVSKNAEFYPRPCKKLEIGEKIKGKLLENEGNCSFLVDLQAEHYGLPFLSFYSEREQNIHVTWGEHIADGKVRSKIGRRDFSFDLKAKKGENSYTNYMLRLGCRYMELHSEFPVKLKELGMYKQFYPVKAKKAKLPTLLDQQIYDLSKNSLFLCMMEHYVDCIWREQCLYAFDSRNQMLFGYDAFENGNGEYARANLKLMSMDRREDGFLSICYPCGVDLVIPSYSLHYIIACREYYEHTGDEAFLKEVYPKLTELILTFRKNVKNGLLLRVSGEFCWNFYDWSPYLSGDLGATEEPYPDAVLNCLYILALQSYEKISTVLSKNFPFESLLNTLKEGVRRNFFNKKTGLVSLLADKELYLTLPSALFILCGLASKEEQEKLSKALVSGKLFPCSIGMRPFLYDALLETDEEQYKGYILEEIRNTYKIMVESGASATWETMEGQSDFGNAGSLCHGWTAVPIRYYHKFGMVTEE